MKLQKYISKLLDVLIALVLLLFFASFGFRDGRTSGWYQQFLPNLNGSSITDITFVDSLNGYAVTNVANGNSYILKTTNGGDNWIIKLTNNQMFARIEFINSNIGYTNAFTTLYKTTNAGENWNAINLPDIIGDDMFVLNEDTIWLAMRESLTGGVHFTSNGGLSWTRQFSGGTDNPNKIYMFNARIGFIKNNNNSSSLKKTTNGGVNWFSIYNEGFFDMYFTDSLNGWRAGSYVKMTTNGGFNWTQQQLPQGVNGQTIVGGVNSLSKFSKDTLWGSYATVLFPNQQYRGILFRTTNGGINWFYQIPDTTINIPAYSFTNFINNKTGWAYNIITSGIHTTTGGDTSFLSSVHQISNDVPKDYLLFQNYPNPFNAKSNIKYQISKISDIQIKIFDIQGKEISILVNKKQTPGTYEYNFDASNLSSGIYYYTLFVDGNKIDTKKAVLLK